MNTARSLWASIQGNPKTMLRIHGFLAVFWFAAAFPILLTDLKKSIEVLTFLSVYAIVSGHWSSYQASRVEVKQDEAT